jgi:hypothetical protein
LGFGASGRLCLDGEVESTLMIRVGWWRQGERMGVGRGQDGEGRPRELNALKGT